MATSIVRNRKWVMGGSLSSMRFFFSNEYLLGGGRRESLFPSLLPCKFYAKLTPISKLLPQSKHCHSHKANSFAFYNVSEWKNFKRTMRARSENLLDILLFQLQHFYFKRSHFFLAIIAEFFRTKLWEQQHVVLLWNKWVGGKSSKVMVLLEAIKKDSNAFKSMCRFSIHPIQVSCWLVYTILFPHTLFGKLVSYGSLTSKDVSASADPPFLGLQSNGLWKGKWIWRGLPHH